MKLIECVIFEVGGGWCVACLYGGLFCFVVSNVRVCTCVIVCVLVQRSFEPPQVKHERLMIVSIAGFVVNLIGIFVFHHGGSGKGWQCRKWESVVGTVKCPLSNFK